MNQPLHEKHLLELTSLPTAAGREGRVIDWITRWVRRRRRIVMTTDHFGNEFLQQRGVASPNPIVFEAHMDHPAFVITGQRDDRHVEAVFRGGVGDDYFVGSPVRVHLTDGGTVRGVVTQRHPPQPPALDPRIIAVLDDAAAVQAGEVMTWDLPPAVIRDGHLHAPACDDLAGVAAALAAFDTVLGRQARRRRKTDVRVLLTRAEEVGFVGAMAACRGRHLPRRSRIIALENSRAFADAPIHAW